MAGIPAVPALGSRQRQKDSWKLKARKGLHNSSSEEGALEVGDGWMVDQGSGKVDFLNMGSDAYVL